MNGTIAARMIGGPADKLRGEVVCPPPDTLTFGATGGFVYRLVPTPGKGVAYTFDRAATYRALIAVGVSRVDAALATGRRDDLLLSLSGLKQQQGKEPPLDAVKAEVDMYSDHFALRLDNLIVARLRREGGETPDDIQAWVEAEMERILTERADTDAAQLVALELGGQQ